MGSLGGAAGGTSDRISWWVSEFPVPWSMAMPVSGHLHRHHTHSNVLTWKSDLQLRSGF